MNATIPSATLAVHKLGFTVSGQALLNGIDLDVGAGERLAVIGPNGAGKSSLLRCLYTWWQPTNGVVLLDGTDVARLTPTERGRRIGVLMQESEGGLGLSVEEVVRMGRLPHSETARGAALSADGWIDRTLLALDLSHYRNRIFSTLSGGEKQRVLFARALAQEPQLLILDEPTNHLDIRHQIALLDVARALGVAVVATLHDINLAARWADRLCLMDRGQVRAIGTPDAVLTPALLGEVYGVDVDRDREPRTGAIRLSFHAKDRT